MSTAAALAGFTLAFSLILAIGAQNAFVLKQGLKREHVFLVCIICAVSDALLIAAGVSGFGVVVARFPSVEMFARYFGALFLLGYGIKSLVSAFTTEHTLDPAGEDPTTALRTALICLAFTWLNPHVYLDTMFLLGSISTHFDGARVWFAAGAMSASFVFFFSLGYGSRLLIPLFHNPRSWRVLDALIGLVMLAIAASLVYPRA